MTWMFSFRLNKGSYSSDLMWIRNAAAPLGVPSIERDGHPFFGFWKIRTRTPNSTLIYCFCFAAFEKFYKCHFTSNRYFTDSELVLIDHRNWTCYLWFSEKPAFGCYNTSWVSDSLGSISSKLRMCSKIYAYIMNYTVWPRWSPNELGQSFISTFFFFCSVLFVRCLVFTRSLTNATTCFGLWDLPTVALSRSPCFWRTVAIFLSWETFTQW